MAFDHMLKLKIEKNVTQNYKYYRSLWKAQDKTQVTFAVFALDTLV